MTKDLRPFRIRIFFAKLELMSVRTIFHDTRSLKNPRVVCGGPAGI